MSTESSDRYSPLARTVLATLAWMILLCAIGLLIHGMTGFEKTLTKLVMPLGGCWLLLGGWLLQNAMFGTRRSALLPTAAWLVITITSCQPISEMATRYLEGLVEIPPLSTAKPLDIVVVLGGGTNQGPSRAQAANSGDRVLYAAQLYKQGYTKQLITTGQASASMSGSRIPDPSEQTIEIWTALGIPREDISILPGINTFREIEALEGAIQSGLAGKRIGILTSATHLPRAMRLAKARGLSELVPIAADYRAAKFNYRFEELLPGADALAQFTRCQHEFMARLLNR